jgi:(2Fe-2S) ferredoxin
MPDFERHVFVCTNVRGPDHPRGCCSARESEAIREALKTAAKKRLGKTVRVNTAGCLDQCEHGVTIVVYPEQVWYGFVRMEDVEEIVESHLVNGHPVERLRLPPECLNTPGCPHKQRGPSLTSPSPSAHSGSSSIPPVA